MTKFILVGGYRRKTSDDGKKFTEEVVSGFRKQSNVVLASNYQDLLVGNATAIDVCEQNIKDLVTLHPGDRNASEWVIRKINLLPESPAK